MMFIIRDEIESELDGFGFKRSYFSRTEQIPELSSSYLPVNIKEKITCPKIDTIENKPFGKYLHYPEFQKIFVQCRNEFMENKSCFAMCILVGIINRKDYGDLFLQDIDDGNDTQQEGSPNTFQSHQNIFCYAKVPSTRICIVDDGVLSCNSSLGNCNVEGNEAFVFTTGNSAHRFTCETLDKIQWKYFENSTTECILPESKILLSMKRYIFKNCSICSNYREGDRFGSITEYSSPPSKEEFSKVPYSSLPIVIRNGANMEGIPALNFSFIKQLYKDFNHSSSVDNETKCTFAQFTMNASFESFAHALSLIMDDKSLDFDWYIGWEVCHPEVSKQFRRIIPRPSFLPDDGLASVNLPWMVAGSPGSGVFDHVDHVKKPIWQAQLAGNKKWYLRPPPECHHVCTKLFVVTVNQGDLFLLHNNAWYHMTVVTKNNLSITYGTSYDFEENF